MSGSTFLSLSVGLSALETMQQALNVSGNNIANANTPGYARERAVVVEGPGLPPAGQDFMGGQMGTGAYVTKVTRLTDPFINGLDRSNQSSQKKYEVLNQNWSEIQGYLNEPSSASIQNSMDQFFQSIQTLSTDPTNPAAQQTVVSEAQTLANTYNTMVGKLEQMQQGLQQAVQGQWTQLQTYASEVASLNGQITQISASAKTIAQSGVSVSPSQSPNTLMDQRSAILDKMAQLANIQTTDGTNGAVTVTLGGQTLVPANGSAAQLTLQSPSGATIATSPQTSTGNIATTSLTSGGISGNLEGIDANGELLSSLTALANALTSPTGTLAGLTTNGPLMSAATDPNAPAGLLTTGTVLTVNSNNPAFTTGVAPQPTVASIANNLQNAQQSSGSYSFNALTSAFQVNTTGQLSGTFDQMLTGVTSTVGTQAASAQEEGKTAQALATQSANLRQSVSGVDTNEELTNVIQYQNSYNAAAKFISVFNQMLQNLITNV